MDELAKNTCTESACMANAPQTSGVAARSIPSGKNSAHMEQAPLRASALEHRRIELDLIDTREECRRLARAGAEMHDEILALNRALLAARQQVQILLVNQRELEQLRATRHSLQAQVDALVRSGSWRITKPIRMIYSLLSSHS
jgi:hypothetical protein